MQIYHTHPVQSNRVRTLIPALAATGMILLLIPLSHMLESAPPKKHTLRQIDTVIPPPPPLPPEPPPPPEPEKTTPPPRLHEELKQLTLEPLDLDLRPGLGGALVMGLDLGALHHASDAATDIELYPVEQLDRVPHIINQPQFAFPSSLARQGIDQGKVVLEVEINEKGRVKVLGVLRSSHHELEGPAVRAAGRALFETPMKDGQSVRASYTWPLVLTR